ncbi:MAG: NnrS family protein [Verrucomicrobiales bacterium]
MSFPACRHKNRRSVKQWAGGVRWLAAEPYRVFFASGILWSVMGVALWPMFYAHQLDYYPNLAHARLMIQAFGGAFVVGFLGTAGPRMATAPKLTPAELCWLFLLHQAGAVSHLGQRTALGDSLFLALLASLVISLVVRVVRFRRDAPPPQMLLALTGLLSGMVGTALLLADWSLEAAWRLRLANLFLYQGLLLPPVLGIGSFVFPRLLGGGFGEPRSGSAARIMAARAGLAAVLLVGSFVLEARGWVLAGYGVRVAVAAAYLAIEVRWRRQPDDGPRGSLTTGLYWSLGLGILGLSLPAFFYPQRVAIEHLLYIGGFGMVMLVVASRVLFGHSGDLAGFFARRHWIHFLIFLGVLAAVTRVVPAWVPKITVSHHIYAAVTWAALALLWLGWHGRRFLRREEDDE